jgi:hypothetical protein
MKRIFLALLLAAPVLFSSCSKDETTIFGIDTIEYDKRLPVSKSDLVKYELLRTLANSKYEYMVFKNNVAGVLVTDLNNKAENWAYCSEWGGSNNTLTMVTEEGATMTFEVSKEYKKAGANSYTIIVYMKGSNGKEYGYECIDDGGNSAMAANIWAIINNERALKQGNK